MENENKQLALLINGKSTKELVSVEVYTQIKESINNYLSEDRFNYIVNPDNLKEVKSNNAELNSSIKIIKDFGKKLVDLESSDINIFKSNIKEYWEVIEQKRQSRLKDIEVFESETKKVLSDLLIDYTYNHYKILNIRTEFQKDDYNDLVIISNITTKGQLTKGAKDSLNMRLQQCKSKQDKFDMRLLQLENTCYQNGLETPLTLNHIQGIIYEDNDIIYQDKLNKLIADEIERVANIKAQMKKKIEEDATKVVNAQIKKANEIFLQPWGMMEVETLEKKKIEIESYDISEFNLCIDHAKKIQSNAVTFIGQAIWGKRKTLEDSKKVIDEMVSPFEEVVNNTTDVISEKFDIPQHELLKDINQIVVKAPSEPQNIQVDFNFSETEIVDNIQDSEIIKNFAYYDGEQIPLTEPFVPYEKENEDEKIIVAKFKITGTTGLTDNEALSAIKDILFNAGVCDDSLVSFGGVVMESLKALEILIDSRNNIIYSMKYSRLNKDELVKYEERVKCINEAITELEQLDILHNKEISTLLIDIDEAKNEIVKLRSCDNCKHLDKKEKNLKFECLIEVCRTCCRSNIDRWELK